MTIIKTNCLVSRIPEFAGADGKIYNAVWGPVHITKVDDKLVVYVGKVCLSGMNTEKLVFVPTPELPKFQPNYFSADQRLLKIYDASK